MEYKASLDWPGRIITMAILTMGAGIIYKNVNQIILANGDFIRILPNVLLILFIAGIIIFCYLFAPKKYVLNNSDLTIKRPIGDIKIKFDDFEAFRRVEDGGALGGIRTFGVGGLFGDFGRFYLREVGSVTAYATKRTNRILIVTRQGNRIIITPDQASFVDNLKKKLSTQTYSLN